MTLGFQEGGEGICRYQKNIKVELYIKKLQSTV